MAMAPALPLGGIEIDEKLAARFPIHETRDRLNSRWSDVRRLDGMVIK